MYRFGLLFKQIFIAAAAMLPAALWGQALSGRVVECGSGQPLAGVAIRVAGSTNGTSTDGEGEFRLAASGDMVLEFSCTGMKPVRRTVRAPAGRPLRLDVCMEDAVTELGSVTVEARFERKSLKDAREQGVPVSVIDGKSLAGRGTSITEVINHQTGVKIRRTGNTGNDTKVNVRGLEGNRVQIYLDGYALNTPDGSFSINDIPLQFIERIEIYKGIVPPEFGGDGLGSAINIVTIDAQGSYYDAWYSLKSHNVSEGSLLYKHYFPKAKMYSAVMIGGEHSLNNYTMQSPYVEGLKIRRNHDRFRKVDGAVTFDFKERYFDEFEIENVFFVSDRQVQGIQTNIQHAVSSGWIAAITPKLEKRGFLTEKLDMKFVGLA
ncbi:MAG: TonB-dependent receptor plug domain-containing protein, partial [Tannerellaceae bacterium]|nr:TonB-dependent receptor plug domain-containing protein [Tannerellaceae bacterium]